ncbi:hypothetical protein Y032_0306g1973 [Ancylostoma ceylanicum]|uniref:Uncharacterized protein n=1 Tax=Ancylostoma ceylanicum TaxID=53326 RepID=A0A016S2T4_9BILA|nr:hypothetical protein Y032_0306g1973 [Ancylostoma ceylanicum]
MVDVGLWTTPTLRKAYPRADKTFGGQEHIIELYTTFRPSEKTYKSKRQAVNKRAPPNNLEIAAAYKAFLDCIYETF